MSRFVLRGGIHQLIEARENRPEGGDPSGRWKNGRSLGGRHCDRSWLKTLRLLGNKIIHGNNRTRAPQLEQCAANSCAFPPSEY
jgi:hypothetical protein